MKTQIEKLITFYDIRINEEQNYSKKLSRLIGLIRNKYNQIPCDYESDMDYQDYVKDMAVTFAKIQAYIQAKHDFDSLLDKL